MIPGNNILSVAFLAAPVPLIQGRLFLSVRLRLLFSFRSPFCRQGLYLVGCSSPVMSAVVHCYEIWYAPFEPEHITSWKEAIHIDIENRCNASAGRSY